MKFLCLNLWLGQVCTDDTNDGGHSMIIQGSLVDKQNNVLPVLQSIFRYCHMYCLCGVQPALELEHLEKELLHEIQLRYAVT